MNNERNSNMKIYCNCVEHIKLTFGDEFFRDFIENGNKVSKETVEQLRKKLALNNK